MASSSIYWPLPFRRAIFQVRDVVARAIGNRSVQLRRVGQYLLLFTIVLVGYLIAGKLGQATTNIRSNNLGPVWPAYGVALAAILVCGYRIWPAVTAASFLVAFWSPESALTALGQASGCTLAALSGSFFLRRLKFENSLSRLRDVIALVLLGAFGSAIVSASAGAFVLYASGVHAYSGLGPAWLIYWLGDGTGVLLVTPLVLAFPNSVRIRARDRVTEFVALMLLLSATCFLIFGDFSLIPVSLHVLAFAVLPFVMWGAIRFAVVGASLSILLAATIATVETALGFGPFAYTSAFKSAVLLDVFFWVLSVSGLTLASVIVERESAERERERVVSQQASAEALADVSRKLVETQERERRRIARELHDDINQRLGLLAVELGQLEEDSSNVPPEIRNRMRELRQDTTELSVSVQALSHDLHSSRLEFLGAAGGLKSLCREFSERQKMEVDFIGCVAPNSVPSEIGLCLFRVLQEALHNSRKHSGVKHVAVQLKEELGVIHLIVSDSGHGFDVEAARTGGGLGITSMRERVRLVNGTIAIHSKPMGGTRIHVRVPLPGRNSQLAV